MPQKQIISTQLGAGVDTSEDPKLLKDGLLKLENARTTRRGELRKRFGSAQLTGSHTERFLTTFKDRPIAIDNESFKLFDGSVYNSGDFDAASTSLPTLCDVDVSRVEALDKVVWADAAEYGDVRAVLYCSAYSLTSTSVGYYLYLSTYSLTNGLLLDSVTLPGGTATKGGGRVLWTGDRMLAITTNNTGVVSRRVINTTTGAIGSGTDLNSGSPWIDNNVAIDVCIMNDANYSVLIAGVDSTTDTTLRVIVLDKDNNESTTTQARAGGSADQIEAVGCYFVRDGVAAVVDCLYMGVAAQDVITIGGYDATATLQNAEDTITLATVDDRCRVIVAARAGGDTLGTVYFSQYDVTAGSGEHLFQTWKVTAIVAAGSGACTLGTPGLFQMGVILSSKPMWSELELDHYLLVVNPDAWRDQIAYILMKGTDAAVYARVLHGYAMKPNGWDYHATNPHEISDTNWRVAVPHRTTGTADLFGVSVLDINFDVTTMQCQETEHTLIVPGGLPHEFDGRNVAELGFSWYPTKLSATATGTGLTGTYGYKAVYEYLDAAGRWHQSAASPTVSVELDNDACDIVVSTLACTSMSNVRIAIYRTQANGAFFYRLGSLANSKTATSVTWAADSMADSVLVANQKLYSMAELDNIQPGGFRVSCIHQERLCYAHREWENTRVFYSKTFLPNTGVQFNEGLLITVSPDGGRITGLSSFQDRLLIFKKDRIYASHGTGFNATGGGTNYSVPQLISPGVGCVDQKTIVRLPQGVAFIARDGLYMLDNQLQLHPLGEPVQYWTDQYTYVCSAFVPALHIAVWMSSDASAPALVYDYLFGSWSTWTNRRVHDCTVAMDGYLYWTGYGESKIYSENRSVYTDNAAAVTLKIRTPWYIFGQLLGQFRLYNIQLLGQSLADALVRVKAFFNYDPVPIDDEVYDLDALTGHFDADEHYGDGLDWGYANNSLILQLGTSRQVLRAISLEISDESPGGGVVQTSSFLFNALAFEVALLGGMAKRDIGASRRF